MLLAKGNKNNEITEALILCKDNAPFSTVDGSDFKYFLKVACPLYQIPSRNTIKNKLDIKYNYLSAKLKLKLKENIYFTLTSDIWTDIQMKSYIGVTIHFLEGNKFVSGIISLLILKEIRDLMHPLEDLTKKISGDKYAIISTILPLVNCVHRATSNFQTITSIGIDLQKLIIYELDKRFKDLEIFYDFPLATLLDPRYLYILIN